MKNLNIKKIIFAIFLALAVLGIGYYTSVNADVIFFTLTHPKQVREAQKAYQNTLIEAEIKFSERLGTFVSPQ